MSVEAVISTQVIDTTTLGRSIMTAADAAAARTALSLGTLATQSGTFSGTSSGTNTGDQSSVSGNAGSATVLQTARNINGVAFDGSANITVTAAGSTLSDTVTVAKGGTGLTALGSALQTIRVNAGGTALEYVTASGLSGTGSVDNAVLRADGTGGATLQNSLVTIADTAATVIPVSSASAIPLLLKGAASQSANLQEWQNASGTVMVSVDMISAANGRIKINGSVPNAAITLSAFGADGYIDCATGDMYFRTNNTTRTNFTLNNLSTKVATFGGAVTIGSSTDAAAANSTLYYSTTQSKLVWKDAGGTVNVLY